MKKLFLSILFIIGIMSLSFGQTTVWVDDDFDSGTTGWGITHFATIQNGINAVDAGGTVNVAAGTYGSVSLNKSVTLNGANAGIHPAVGMHTTETVGTRGAETILQYGNGPGAISVSADNVTLDGFKITSTGLRIIDTYADADYFTLKNCIWENSSTTGNGGTIQFGGGSHTSMVLEFNKFINGEQALLYTGGSFDNLTIQYNYINSLGDAVFWTASPLVDGKIKGNEIDGTRNETPGQAFCTFNIGQAGNIQVTDNWVHDVYYTAFQLGIINGSVTGNKFQNIIPYDGYFGSCFELWGGQYGTAASSNVTITDNEFHFNDIAGASYPTNALRLRAPDGSEIDGSTIYVHDNKFYNGEERTDAYAIWDQSNQIGTVDASENYWGTSTPDFDALFNGPVTYAPYYTDEEMLTLYTPPVHNTTQDTYFETIQDAVNNAVSGDVINVAAGTYTEGPQIVIDKDLSIVGADPSTTIIKPTANTGSGGDSRGWFLVNDGYTFNLSNVTLDGTGYDVYQAIRDKGTGTIDNCTFKEIKYPSYQGFAIAAFSTSADMNVDITNCEFSEIGRVGVLYYGTGITGSTFSGNTYTGKGDGDWLDYALDISAGAIVTVDNNTVTNNKGVASSDGSTSAGFLVSTYFGPGTEADFTNNTISNNSTGIAVGYDEFDVSSVTAHNNSITGNTSNGVSSTGPTVDATSNWWGDTSGPFHATTNSSGTGDEVSDNVDYTPWVEVSTISATGTPYSTNTSGATLTFSTLPSGGGTVTVNRINTAPPVAPPSGATVAPIYFEITSSMANNTFSAEVVLNVSGISGFTFTSETQIAYYNTTTSQWVFISGGSYNAGAGTYTFTTDHFTTFAFINTPETAYDVYLSNSTTAESGLIYPNDSWGSTSYESNDWDFEAPVEFYIVPEVNTEFEFGACDITLQWDNTMFSLDGVDATGGIFNGLLTFFTEQLGTQTRVTIQAALLGENHTVAAGDYIAKLSLNLLKPGYGAIDFIAMDFRAFDGSNAPQGVYVVGNGAEVKSYLGDVTTNGDASTGDGAVDFDDLDLWSYSYWSGVSGFSSGMDNYKVKYDVGPTADNTVYTLPETDAQIQFEDLMIFSMSYGLSANGVYPKVPAMPEEPIELKLGEGVLSGQYRIIPVELEGSISDVRGISLSFSGQVEEVQKGELLEKGETPTLLLNRQLEGIHNVDMSVVGYNAETINLSGTIAYIKVREGEKISIASADIRNSRNQKFNLKISGTSSAVPESFELSQNYPNPFNPTTMIKYQLPEDRQVVLKIFNALGQQVTELVNEVQKAGYYEVQFNGADLSSGVYFYHITAGDFTSVKKMMLIK